MSRILGIDYGTKNVGLSVSDEMGDFAYPHSVVKNSPTLLQDIESVCTEKQINLVVMGDSKNYKGEENTIMEDAKKLAEDIQSNLKIDVVFHPEFLTSVQAEKMQGKNELTDASAATIMLQSYLDTEKNKKSHA